MVIEDLINKKVIIYFSEPWDLGTQIGVKHYAKILGFTDDQIILELLKPFSYEQHDHHYICASCRHQGFTIHNLMKDKELTTNFCRIDKGQAMMPGSHLDLHIRTFFAIGNIDIPSFFQYKKR